MKSRFCKKVGDFFADFGFTRVQHLHAGMMRCCPDNSAHAGGEVAFAAQRFIPIPNPDKPGKPANLIRTLSFPSVEGWHAKRDGVVAVQAGDSVHVFGELLSQCGTRPFFEFAQVLRWLSVPAATTPPFGHPSTEGNLNC